MKTTNIKILKIEPGAQYDNRIWDYWIIAQLENSEIITIFDSECYIERFKVGECLQVVLSALFATTKVSMDGRLFVITQIEALEDLYVISNDHMAIYLNKEDLTHTFSNDYMVVQIDSIRLKEVII